MKAHFARSCAMNMKASLPRDRIGLTFEGTLFALSRSYVHGSLEEGNTGAQTAILPEIGEARDPSEYPASRKLSYNI